jgi:calcium binding protein 39
MSASVLKSVKVKTGADLVNKTSDSLKKFDAQVQKTVDETAKFLDALKTILYGNTDDNVIAQIAQEAYKCHLLKTIVTTITRLVFESKKDAVQIFNKLLRREIGTNPAAMRFPTVEYICSTPEILTTLIKSYEEREPVDALNAGIMLRECIKNEPLAKVVVHDEQTFELFFSYVQLSTFDVAADAFSSFKELMTTHKILSADFLEKNYDRVFSNYTGLLESENYVTRRQALKLLGELLLDRANFTIMTKYISDPANLKLMMNMLRDPSKNIQFEAFHVFKVFVANPNKTQPILDILLKNQSKLVQFLDKFHESRKGEDEQFSDEKAYLIKQIKDLK